MLERLLNFALQEAIGDPVVPSNLNMMINLPNIKDDVGRKISLECVLDEANTKDINMETLPPVQ